MNFSVFAIYPRLAKVLPSQAAIAQARKAISASVKFTYAHDSNACTWIEPESGKVIFGLKGLESQQVSEQYLLLVSSLNPEFFNTMPEVEETSRGRLYRGKFVLREGKPIEVNYFREAADADPVEGYFTYGLNMLFGLLEAKDYRNLKYITSIRVPPDVKLLSPYLAPLQPRLLEIVSSAAPASPIPSLPTHIKMDDIYEKHYTSDVETLQRRIAELEGLRIDNSGMDVKVGALKAALSILFRRLGCSDRHFDKVANSLMIPFVHQSVRKTEAYSQWRQGQPLAEISPEPLAIIGRRVYELHLLHASLSNAMTGEQTQEVLMRSSSKTLAAKLIKLDLATISIHPTHSGSGLLVLNDQTKAEILAALIGITWVTGQRYASIAETVGKLCELIASA